MDKRWLKYLIIRGYIYLEKGEKWITDRLYFFSAQKIVIAVKFIVIAVHATSNTMNNIMNGDMFYNLEFEIHLFSATVDVADLVLLH